MPRTFIGTPWLRRRTHISWLIAVASFGILLGVSIAPRLGTMFVDATWLIVAAALFAIACVKRLRYMMILVLVAGLLVGFWRGSIEHAALSQYSQLLGKQHTITGTVSEDTTFGPKGDLRLRVSSVRVDDRPMTGTIWVSVMGEHTIKRGDQVALSGVLTEGFGNIPSSMYRAQVVTITHPVPGDVGRRVRDWFGSGVSRAMPAEYASFAMAYLVGQKLTASETLMDQLRTIGLIHAVVASGYHLTVLVGVTRRLSARTSKYLSTLLSAAMIGGFIMITGFSPSMSRAGLVSGLSLAAWYYGRVIHPLVLLPFSAAITVLVQPAYIWGDVGWYLSFVSFAGVLMVAPLLNEYFWGDKKPGIIREVLVATFAAQLVTLPLTVHVFGYFSVYALLANLLVVPLVPLVMLLTFIAGVVGLAAPALATLFGWPVRVILQYMIEVVDWIAHLPGAKTELQLSILWLVCSYVVIIGIIIFLWLRTRYDFRADNSEKLL